MIAILGDRNDTWACSSPLSRSLVPGFRTRVVLDCRIATAVTRREATFAPAIGNGI